MKYEFTYEELKPLIDYLNKEPYPSERHFLGIKSIWSKLTEIGNEETKSEEATSEEEST
jgi:hypothetical protein